MDATELEAMSWAFDYFHQLDKANACIHCAPVKFSPITFRLAGVLIDNWPASPGAARLPVELEEVRDHQDKYELDTGR